MTHLDLFSGIGGFAYAADQVWDDVEHIFCDSDRFCREVLKRHWPESEIYDDIRSITADSLRLGSERWGDPRNVAGTPPGSQKPSEERQRDGYASDNSSSVDLLTGGFPCQPFSQAGRRRGTEDDRFLWPEMLRVIRLTQPTWVIAENVRGLLTLQGGVVFEQVCVDLESSGYEVQPFIIPAVAVNAPHRRDRVWFVARHAEHDGLNGAKNPESDTQGSHRDSQRTDELRQSQGADSLRPDVAHPRRSDGRARLNDEHRQPPAERSSKATEAERRGEADTNPQHKGLERRSHEESGHVGQPSGDGGDKGWSWEQDWLEVATRFCSVDDGLPAEVGDFALTKSGHRKEQLKAYGNAIVPQVAIEIMKGMS